MRFVIFEEEGILIAVCLEHFIGAQGKDIEGLKMRLKIAYRAERDDSCAQTGVPFKGIPPAPDIYQQMWEDDGPCITRGTIVDKDEDEIRLAA